MAIATLKTMTKGGGGASAVATEDNNPLNLKRAEIQTLQACFAKRKKQESVTEGGLQDLAAKLGFNIVNIRSGYSLQYGQHNIVMHARKRADTANLVGVKRFATALVEAKIVTEAVAAAYDFSHFLLDREKIAAHKKDIASSNASSKIKKPVVTPSTDHATPEVAVSPTAKLGPELDHNITAIKPTDPRPNANPTVDRVEKGAASLQTIEVGYTLDEIFVDLWVKKMANADAMNSQIQAYGNVLFVIYEAAEQDQSLDDITLIIWEKFGSLQNGVLEKVDLALFARLLNLDDQVLQPTADKDHAAHLKRALLRPFKKEVGFAEIIDSIKSNRSILLGPTDSVLTNRRCCNFVHLSIGLLAGFSREVISSAAQKMEQSLPLIVKGSISGGDKAITVASNILSGVALYKPDTASPQPSELSPQTGNANSHIDGVATPKTIAMASTTIKPSDVLPHTKKPGDIKMRKTGPTAAAVLGVAGAPHGMGQPVVKRPDVNSTELKLAGGKPAAQPIAPALLKPVLVKPVVVGQEPGIANMAPSTPDVATKSSTQVSTIPTQPAAASSVGFGGIALADLAAALEQAGQVQGENKDLKQKLEILRQQLDTAKEMGQLIAKVLSPIKDAVGGTNRQVTEAIAYFHANGGR